MILTFEEFCKRTPPGRLLGLDVGKKNIGVSLSDDRWYIATPFTTFSDARFLKVVQMISEYIHHYHISLIIVGLPFNMTGELGRQYQWVRQFVQRLGKKIDLPFFLQDERLSTKAAYRPLVESGVSWQKREAAIDKVAACYILQTAIDRRNAYNVNKN